MNKINKKILALVPIKEHSTRIPNKNIRDLAGKPMMAYILETLKGIKRLDRIVVSTESEKVADIARKYGADVPFIRPVELTRDDITTYAVVKHAVAELEKKERYIPDYVLLVYATSPLLKAERIEQAIDIAFDKDSDTVFSGVYDKGHYWKEAISGWIRFYPTTERNSQFQEPLVKENGAICLTKILILKKQMGADKSDVLIMNKDENIDVDYPEDFAAVEAILLKENKKKK